jgi:hypothetical protein
MLKNKFFTQTEVPFLQRFSDFEITLFPTNFISFPISPSKLLFEIISK